VTLLAEQLPAGEAEAIIRKAIELALGGDVTALRLCVDRILPPLKSRPVSIPITKNLNIADISVALDGVTQAMAAGTITPEEAKSVANVLEARRRALVAVEARCPPGKMESPSSAGCRERPTSPSNRSRRVPVAIPTPRRRQKAPYRPPDDRWRIRPAAIGDPCALIRSLERN
jgi:hypothetical protein